MGTEVTAEEVFKMYHEVRSNELLALNIKIDGLQDMMEELLKNFKIANYFFFDMSVCDTVIYVEKQLNIASIRSKYQ